MSKTLHCAEITGDCDFRAVGETVEEVVQLAAAHAKNDHGLQVTGDLVEQMRQAVRDD
jgi:predicted small metal-binding protein